MAEKTETTEQAINTVPLHRRKAANDIDPNDPETWGRVPRTSARAGPAKSKHCCHRALTNTHIQVRAVHELYPAHHASNAYGAVSTYFRSAFSFNNEGK